MPVGFGLIIRLVFGVLKPKQPILGSELAGVVESVGKDVTKSKAGDHVFAFSDAAMGCHAEYKCMPQDTPMALKPANLTFGEAAAISFGGTTALNFLRKRKLQRGESVLVNGACGGVGSAAVRLAKHFGADVTGVCSPANVELVRPLGASHFIDYTKEDFTQNGVTLCRHSRSLRHGPVPPEQDLIEGRRPPAYDSSWATRHASDSMGGYYEQQENDRWASDHECGRFAFSRGAGWGGRIQAGH